MEFYKLSATNNDFILTMLDSPSPFKIELLCNRYIGIGADGYINIDRFYNVTIYNKDGSKANMCGNGLRCVNKLLHMLTKKSENIVYINNEPIKLKMIDNNTSIIEFKKIKMKKVDKGYQVNVCNNHLIQIVDNVDTYNFSLYDIQYCNNYKCNIQIVEIIDRNTIKIKTYEYGVGQTNSCGSGSIATFFMLYNLNMVNKKINILTNGGNLKAIFDKYYYLQADVKFIYKGEYNGFC